jgi:SAM-dependent methyltransferase
METKDVRDAVRDAYGRIAEESTSASSCGCSPSCCGGGSADAFARGLGYEDADLAALPEGANLGLSCGNPTALASPREGEVVLDLGSGAGLDVFIAARAVKASGRVIGVDMTPAMVSKARANAARAGLGNVEFRLGEIENLPVADASVDVVISNCVINLSPDKGRVFREIARVLKPGGRVAVSDMALLRPLPDAVREEILAYVGCVAGAVLLDEYVGHLRAAGFTDIVVEPKTGANILDGVQDPLYGLVKDKLPESARPEDYVVSVNVRAKATSAPRGAGSL